MWPGGMIASSYLGLLITAFIINKEPWSNAFWVNTGPSALCWLFVVSLMDETLYNRKLAQDQQPVPKRVCLDSWALSNGEAAVSERLSIKL